MTGGGRRPGRRVGASIEKEVAHAAAFARKNHLVLVLDEVHAARARVDEKRTVAAASETAAARLGDDDVGHAFSVWPGRRPGWRRAASAAPATTAAARRAHAWQQLRRWNHGA